MSRPWLSVFESELPRICSDLEKIADEVVCATPPAQVASAANRLYVRCQRVLDRDVRELLAAALKYLGYSVNDVNEERWKQARAVFLRDITAAWQELVTWCEEGGHQMLEEQCLEECLEPAFFMRTRHLRVPRHFESVTAAETSSRKRPSPVDSVAVDGPLRACGTSSNTSKSTQLAR